MIIKKLHILASEINAQLIRVNILILNKYNYAYNNNK